MKLYLLSQGSVSGYDTYDAVVVAAESEEDARTIHPSEFCTHTTSDGWMGMYEENRFTLERGTAGTEYPYEDSGWVEFCDIGSITVRYLGETNEPRGVILASFNAG